MNKRINSKSIVGIIVSVFLLLGIVMPISVMAETPFTIDTALMSATDEPSSYTGGKDAAFAIDGDQTGFIPILPQQAIALKL